VKFSRVVFEMKTNERTNPTLRQVNKNIKILARILIVSLRDELTGDISIDCTSNNETLFMFIIDIRILLQF